MDKVKKIFIFSFLFLAISLMLSIDYKHEESSPNIILVLTDDQGYPDLSAHGSPDVYTPFMDLLKSQSISLEDFHVSPTCAPTRSAILTGRHPFKNAITHTILERERMALGITTIPEVLKKRNYSSGIFGKWHLGDEAEYQPESRGFDEVFIHGAGGIGQAYPGSCADVPDNNYKDPTIKHNGTFVKTKGFCTDIFFTQALDWIKKKSDKKESFFAYISTNAPHGPFIAPERYKKKFKDRGYPEKAQGYYGMVENIDDNLGVLMERLDYWGIADNTILIFMSDNGKTSGGSSVNGTNYNAGMKGMKGSVSEGGTRVPFFIRWPEKFKAGEKVKTLYNHYDILPTFADILDINISEIKNLDGQSFLPSLLNPAHEIEDRYRFVHGGRWPLNPNNINGEEISKNWVGNAENSKPESRKDKGFAVRNERYRFEKNKELYDVIEDPGQKNNIAGDNPEIVSDMKKVYDAWWLEVRPFMINEDVPLAKEKPFWIDFEKQKKENGIQAWVKPDLYKL